MGQQIEMTTEQKGRLWDLLRGQSLPELRASAAKALEADKAVQLGVLHKVVHAVEREDFCSLSELGEVAVKLSPSEMAALQGGFWWPFWNNVLSNGWGVDVPIEDNRLKCWKCGKPGHNCAA